MPRRRSLHDVELVDDLPPGPPTDAPATDRSGRRRALTLGAALLAVLLAVGVIGQVVVDRRDRARIAAIATDPFSIDPVREPPTAGWWQAPYDEVYDLAEVRTPDGLLVGVRDAAEGPVRVAALDIATGEEVWEVDLLDGTRRPDPGTGEIRPASGQCAPHETQEHLAVCLAHDGTSVIDDHEWRTVTPSAARLVTLDTRDGTVVTDLTDALGVEGLVTSFATTGDLVVVTAESEEITDVRAVTSDGTPAWRTTAPAPDGEERRTVVRHVGDLVALVTPTEVRLLDAAGDTVRTVLLDGRFAAGWGDALYVMPSGERAADGVEDGERTTVVRPEGDVEVQGRDVVPLTVDDGSVPDLVLTSDGTTLTAWDGAGEKLWAVSAGSSWLAVLLDGRLHLAPGAEILTIDARTGDELWRSSAATSSPVTDGRLLLAVAASPRRGHSTEMVALDPADGAELWRAPLPEGTQELTAHHRLLFAVQRTADTLEEQLTLLK